MERSTSFTKSDIEAGLRRIGEIAHAEGKLVDIAVYGGSAMAIAWNARASTRDVDAVFDGDTDFIRRATAIVAAETGWPEDWLNDGVKDFLSPTEPF
ncbi:MAG: hypothetical protein Q8O34_09290 [Rhodocyclaceae bacterium]|nr:hypothetical protein [Rhodocyclaceae bacterium]